MVGSRPGLVRMRNRHLVLVVLVALTSALSAGTTKPSARPPFRQELSDGDFKDQMKAALAKLPKLESREQSKEPALGFYIMRVEGGLGADRAKIAPNSTLLAIDGRKVWEERQITSLRADQPHTLKIVDGEGSDRDVMVGVGELGIEGELRFTPDLLYLKGAHRNRKWDALLYVASAMAENDPPLAETAMRKAVQ